MGDASSLGFGHFLQQSDIVARVLLTVLVIMSTISWYLILYKGISHIVRQERSQKFLTFFWSATSLEAVQNELTVHGVREPFGRLTAHSLHAQAHHAKFGAAKLEETGSEQEFLTRTIKKVLDEETTSLENGLTMLATIGATAPFVGLFGTVWGVYHALVAIGTSRLGHARQGRGAGRRGADHDRHRPGRRPAGGHGLQLADPLQPRADRQARRFRLRAADFSVDGQGAARPILRTHCQRPRQLAPRRGSVRWNVVVPLPSARAFQCVQSLQSGAPTMQVGP